VSCRLLECGGHAAALPSTAAAWPPHSTVAALEWMRIYTIGHSTRSARRAQRLLREHGSNCSPTSAAIPARGAIRTSRATRMARMAAGERHRVRAHAGARRAAQAARGFAQHRAAQRAVPRLRRLHGHERIPAAIDKLLSLRNGSASRSCAPRPCRGAAIAASSRTTSTRRGIEVVHIIGARPAKVHEMNPHARDRRRSPRLSGRAIRRCAYNRHPSDGHRRTAASPPIETSFSRSTTTNKTCNCSRSTLTRGATTSCWRATAARRCSSIPR
jgi:hypothetical protein